MEQEGEKTAARGLHGSSSEAQSVQQSVQQEEEYC